MESAYKLQMIHGELAAFLISSVKTRWWKGLGFNISNMTGSDQQLFILKIIILHFKAVSNITVATRYTKCCAM